MRLNEVEFGLSMIDTEDYTSVAVKGSKSAGLAGEDLEDFRERARDASNLLKALAHEPRLMLLCLLLKGEKSVTELETMLSMRQPAVSQQLARLRMDGIVAPRREGKAIYYSLVNEDVRRIMIVLQDIFCDDK
jgi:DNA-binding transcriptional ArsR family regulator